KTPRDLLGHLVVTLAPHTSGGVLARIVGFTDANACFAHPYLIAARRRNCDGDEDSVILLLDSLINFSRSFLPDKRGGLMDGPLASAYGEGSMAEKIDKQLELALRIRAVDPNDVVARIVVHHFLPDLIGNLKAFSSQQVRCTKCGAKYRRIPLRARCVECGGN